MARGGNFWIARGEDGKRRGEDFWTARGEGLFTDKNVF